MDIAVVYESMFGNTHAVAEAIAAGIREADPAAYLTVTRVGAIPQADLGEVGLLVVGGPTHTLRMSSPRTRQQGLQAGHKAADQPHREPEPGAAGPGIREWLDGLPAAQHGGWAAAFDTRLSYPLAGGAARPAARQLRRRGYQLAADPEGFYVSGAEGPLQDGELRRARAWGAMLAHQAAVPSAG
ncbi:MAG TPA: flavodoxin [Streptosporangiaceae bacterium]|nr:flavodoxin [Streptosporangiaceae bacterium]